MRKYPWANSVLFHEKPLCKLTFVGCTLSLFPTLKLVIKPLRDGHATQRHETAWTAVPGLTQSELNKEQNVPDVDSCGSWVAIGRRQPFSPYRMLAKPITGNAGELIHQQRPTDALCTDNNVIYWYDSLGRHEAHPSSLDLQKCAASSPRRATLYVELNWSGAGLITPSCGINQLFR